MSFDFPDFSRYQLEARKTAVYPDIGNNLWYPALGLAGEAGEVCEKVKKVFRDSNGVVDISTRGKLCEELGDVLWYVASVAAELDIDLKLVAGLNLAKLQSRAARDKVHGEGDER